MQQAEIIRAIHVLRRKGWTDTEIVDYILEVSGDAPENGTGEQAPKEKP